MPNESEVTYKIDPYKTASGVAKPLTPEEQAKDDLGFTHPNLHRRVDPQESAEGSKEVAPRKYTLGVYDGINSYRTTEITYHDEESTTCEIP